MTAPHPALDGLRAVPFNVPLRVPVMDVTERRGWLVHGPAGWGEWSPLPSWTDAQRDAAARAAAEAAREGPPPPVRDTIEVNLMVPRVSPEVAHRLVTGSGCRVVKVKVGDPEAPARLEAVRDAVGPRGVVRLDANGSWPDADTALAALRSLAGYGIELCEDPVADMETLAALRRRSPVPVAAESCVRSVTDAARLARLEAADAFVVKPQRIGGARAALAAAEAAGVPTIASSALETSVGLAAVAAVAAALPSCPFAHGIGTALLLGADVTTQPLVPVDGRIAVRPVVPDALEAAR